MKAARKRPHRAEIPLDALALFCLAALLVLPLFRAGYLDVWASIESTFIADARFLMEHWPHPQWQPLWYAGTRFDYVYPPALRYGTAVIAMVFGYAPVRAYHVFVAFFYCVGIAGVSVLVRAAARPRGTAWLGAVLAALVSPSFLILKAYRTGSFRLAPHRLGVLVHWGEGPHMTALALIPFALAFAWRALDERRTTDIALAAIFSAAVVSTNFYGATALAVFYPLLVWSFWITRRDRRMALPAAAIPLAAYGLTAFWLVPSYFKITAANMKYVAMPGSVWSLAEAAAVAAGFVWATRRFAGGRPERTWGVFIAGGVLFFSLDVLGNHFWNFRITGEPPRWVPELDLVYILGGVTILQWLWNRRARLPRIAAAAVVLVALFTAKGYVRHAWQMFRPAPDYRSRVEYQIPDWLSKNMPDARVQTVGSVRFWFDTWRDLPELGGGSDQGLINGLTLAAQWVINVAPQPDLAILWMQAMGVDAVYVSGPQSQEVYKDVKNPEKFAGLLPAVYDDHRGNAIYQVPRRYRVRARVVETARLNAMSSLGENPDEPRLRAYVAAIENGPEVAPELTRDGTDVMRVRARLSGGQSIVVQETYDPAWHAWSGARPLRVSKDPMGLLAVDAPAGDQEVRLQFLTPLENRAGRAVTALTVLLLIVCGVRRRAGRQRT